MGKYHGKCSHDDLSVGHRLRDKQLPLSVPGVSDSMVSSSVGLPVSDARDFYTDGCCSHVAGSCPPMRCGLLPWHAMST